MSNQEMILGGGFSTVLPFSATGGTITTSGAYTIHTFTGSGTFDATNAPIGFSVEYLVVAGGGGGFSPGGGGAGGMRTGSLSLAAGSYTVTVGAGVQDFLVILLTAVILYFQPSRLLAEAEVILRASAGGQVGAVQDTCKPVVQV